MGRNQSQNENVEQMEIQQRAAAKEPPQESTTPPAQTTAVVPAWLNNMFSYRFNKISCIEPRGKTWNISHCLEFPRQEFCLQSVQVQNPVSDHCHASAIKKRD